MFYRYQQIRIEFMNITAESNLKIPCSTHCPIILSICACYYISFIDTYALLNICFDASILSKLSTLTQRNYKTCKHDSTKSVLTVRTYTKRRYFCAKELSIVCVSIARKRDWIDHLCKSWLNNFLMASNQ